MKNLLIIRSANFYQLNINLPSIREQFPNYKISLLTNQSGVETAKKNKFINEIIEYNYSGNFCKKNRVDALKERRFDVVVVLIPSMTDGLFFNALRYGFSIKSKEYYECNIVSEMERITKVKFFQKTLIEIIVRIVAAITTIPVTVLYKIHLILKKHKWRDKVLRDSGGIQP